MENSTPYQTYIESPLQAVLGATLRHVTYWVLVYEEPDFPIETPNAVGLRAGTLGFGERTLEFTWDFVGDLREQNAYYIKADADSDGRLERQLSSIEVFTSIVADNTFLWNAALWSRLDAVEVLGIGSSPQLIRFVFESSTIVISIGYADPDILLRGDGDDVLVFLNDEWSATAITLRGSWRRLWDRNAA